MSQKEKFKKASEEVKHLKTRPDNNHLLKLYALYKQGEVGDVQGTRPGMLDIKGRKKYDSWAELKGTSMEKAQAGYIELVETLKQTHG